MSALDELESAIEAERLSRAKTDKLIGLVNDARKEVEEGYLPRPLFEDGAPVQFGDYVTDKSAVAVGPIARIDIYSTGCYELWNDSDDSIYYDFGEMVIRAVDAQGKIDDDSKLSAVEYAKKYDLPNIERMMMDGTLESYVRNDLLRRQRALDDADCE